jgi:hypothetical protein
VSKTKDKAINLLNEHPSLLNEKWIQHSYPLQQITIQLQGTKHSNKQAILSLLEEVANRIKEGDMKGESVDDDFGYIFKVEAQSPGPSIFGDR